MAVDEAPTTEGERAMDATPSLVAAAVCLLATAAQAQGPRLASGHLESDLVPSPVEWRGSLVDRERFPVELRSSSA